MSILSLLAQIEFGHFAKELDTVVKQIETGCTGSSIFKE